MRPLTQLARILTAIAANRKQLRDRTIARITPWWRDFDGWYDNELVTANAARTADFLDTALRSQASQSAAGTRMLMKALDVEPDKGTEVDYEYGRDVMQLEAYSRPAPQYRFLIEEGHSEVEAGQMALDRLEEIVDMDLADAARQGAQDPMRKSGRVIGWRRMIHPELSKGGTCGLCIAAATQWYTTDQLMPIHDNCHCIPMPVISGEKDPGLKLNDRDLKRFYTEAGSTSTEDLKKTRYKVENGQFTTLLMPEGRRQRGKRAARSATGAPAPIIDYDQAIKVMENNLAKLRRRAAAGEDVSGPIAYHEQHIKRLQDRKAKQGKAALAA